MRCTWDHRSSSHLILPLWHQIPKGSLISGIISRRRRHKWRVRHKLRMRRWSRIKMVHMIPEITKLWGQGLNLIMECSDICPQQVILCHNRLMHVLIDMRVEVHWQALEASIHIVKKIWGVKLSRRIWRRSLRWWRNIMCWRLMCLFIMLILI